MVRRGIDRGLALLARVLLWGFFRGVELDGTEHLPRHRPVLVVANHFNGFVDPVALTRILGRVPRFLAKATLWKVMVARPFLALAGIIPVHRAEDGTTEGNRAAFAATHEALRRHETVALFPEGTTHDDPYLHRLHTGAARIALGARAEGVTGIAIVPVGLVFADKLALRSRVGLRIGPPIDVDTEAARLATGDEPADDTDREAVEALTDLIDARLATVAGHYRDWREAAWSRRAAEIAWRDQQTRPGRPVPLARREEWAQRIHDADPEPRHEVFTRLGRYALDLDELRLGDDQLVPARSLGRLARELVVTALALVLLLPLVATGVTVNALPYLAVRLASSSVAAPVTKGTVRLLVALVAFPLAWSVFAWTNQIDTWFLIEAGVAVACGAATVYLVERWTSLHATWRAFSVRRNAQHLVDAILPDRRALVEAVAAAAPAPQSQAPQSQAH